MPAIIWSASSPGRRARPAARWLDALPPTSTSTRIDMVRRSGSRPAAVASFRTSSHPPRNSSGDRPVGCQPSPRVAARLKRSWTRAAHPQRDRRLLRRLGGELEASEVPARALVVGIGLRPQLLHDLHALVRESTALPERDAQGLELLGHRARPDAQDHPPTRHLIQRRGVLGQLHRVVVRQHQHRGAQADAPGGRCQVGQRGQGMIVGLVIEAFPDVAAVQQMVHDPDGVVAQRFGQWPHGQDLPGISDTPVIRNRHANLHGRYLSRKGRPPRPPNSAGAPVSGH